MQENTGNLYWFMPRMPYVQWESRSLYCLTPESACSRGIQAGCERGLSLRSRLWEVSGVECTTGGLHLCLECCCFCCCVGWVPCLPFYSRKGWLGFYMCKPVNYLWCVEQVTVQTLWRLATSSLRYGWRRGHSCGGSPSPVWAVEVGSEALQHVLQW